MSYTIKKIAQYLDAEFVGDGEFVVNTPRHPAYAGVLDLAVAIDKKYTQALDNTKAQAAILWEGADWQSYNLRAAIIAPQSRYVMVGVTSMFNQQRDLPMGIHESAVIDKTAKLGDGVAIGPFVTIGKNVNLGAGARVFSHVSIAAGSTIGKDAILSEGVRIGENCTIGDRFIAQPNAVVGGDGFSFVTPKPGVLEDARRSNNIKKSYNTQAFERIHSLGGVVIADDVEIGANSTIDAGTIEPTRIGKGTKIDNLATVGHNVQIGQYCLFSGQVGIGGSTKIGNYVIFGGKVGCRDNITIGDNVVVPLGAVGSNVKSNQVMMGVPAVERSKYFNLYRAYLRLPRFMAKK